MLWLPVFKSRGMLSVGFLIIDNLVRPRWRDLGVWIKSIDFCGPQWSVNKRVLVS